MPTGRPGGRRRTLASAAVTGLVVAGVALIAAGVLSQQDSPPSLAAVPSSAPAPETAASRPASTPASTPEAGPTPSPGRTGVTGVPAGPQPRTSPPPDYSPTAPTLPPAEPVSVAIPVLGVRSDLVDLGRARDGSMEVPADFDVAGWFIGSVPPGAVGPAVIAGHVDSRSGPAVFYRLAELTPGAQIEVTRTDGRIAVFRVSAVEQYPKDEFPTARVYGNLRHAGLRLITCGGTFNDDTGHYRDNIVAYAELVASRPV